MAGTVVVKGFEDIGFFDRRALAPELVKAARQTWQLRPQFGYEFPEEVTALQSAKRARNYLRKPPHIFDGVVQLNGYGVGTASLRRRPYTLVGEAQYWHAPLPPDEKGDIHLMAQVVMNRLLNEAADNGLTSVETVIASSEYHEVRAKARGLGSLGLVSVGTTTLPGAPPSMHWSVLRYQF